MSQMGKFSCKFSELQGVQEGEDQNFILKEDFDRLVHRSRLNIEESEGLEFRKRLGTVLRWLKCLDSIDMQEDPNVEPQLRPSSLPLRADVPQDRSVEEILANAPERESDYFVVEKMKWKE